VDELTNERCRTKIQQTVVSTAGGAITTEYIVSVLPTTPSNQSSESPPCQSLEVTHGRIVWHKG
jgi:hypothetical protein